MNSIFQCLICLLLLIGSATKTVAQSGTVLPDQERYNRIVKKLAAGETVESADIQWAIAYEAGNKKTETTTSTTGSNAANDSAKTRDENRMASARTQIGSYYRYSIPAQKNIFGEIVNKDAGEYTLRVKGISSKSSGSKIIFDIRYTRTDNYSCEAMTGELESSLLSGGPGGIYYQKTDGRGTCFSCKGTGKKTVSFSHTNDYEYTLGKKVTYTGSSTIACKECSGSGKTKYLDHLLSCL